MNHTKPTIAALIAAVAAGLRRPNRHRAKAIVKSGIQNPRKPHRNYSLKYHPANRAPISQADRNKIPHLIPVNPILRGEKVEV